MEEIWVCHEESVGIHVENAELHVETSIVHVETPKLHEVNFSSKLSIFSPATFLL